MQEPWELNNWDARISVIRLVKYRPATLVKPGGQAKPEANRAAKVNVVRQCSLSDTEQPTKNSIAVGQFASQKHRTLNEVSHTQKIIVGEGITSVVNQKPSQKIAIGHTKPKFTHTHTGNTVVCVCV